MMRLIAKQDEAFQRRCLPLIHRHLKWNAKRDTMSDANGIVDGMKILSRLKDSSLIELTPFMMKKLHRGGRHYLIDAVKLASTMGGDASSLKPIFKSTLKEAEEGLHEILKRKHHRPIDKITIKRLSERVEALKEGIANVEK